MMSDEKNILLPLSFPQTFLPERRLLAQLLPFAERKGKGNKILIGAETGIPTGKSTGKVEPMIFYALGMGLITASKEVGVWQLDLTPLGNIVLLEDPYFSELQTMWFVHLMLCRCTPANGKADAWYTLFSEGRFRVGENFRQDDFLEFLVERYGDIGSLKSLSGIAIRTYLEDSCLGRIGVLEQKDDDLLIRQIAPVTKEFFPVYASYLYLMWDELFKDENQLSLDSFAQESRIFFIMGWNDSMVATWLDWMGDNGIIQVDRYTGTPMLLRLKSTSHVLAATYSELI